MTKLKQTTTIAPEEEWSFSGFPRDRRIYLEVDPPFEQIARRVADEAICEGAKIDLLQSTTALAPSGTWRACFTIKVNTSSSDLFYNGRDGLRGRYWQGPSRGDEATRHVLHLLKPKLLQFVRTHPECLVSEPPAIRANERSIERSLDAKTAKIWAYENRLQNFSEWPRLDVKRWRNSILGRWAPAGPRLDIKGAFFTRAGEEHVVKPHRACDITNEGFS